MSKNVKGNVSPAVVVVVIVVLLAVVGAVGMKMFGSGKAQDNIDQAKRDAYMKQQYNPEAAKQNAQRHENR